MVIDRDVVIILPEWILLLSQITIIIPSLSLFSFSPFHSFVHSHSIIAYTMRVPTVVYQEEEWLSVIRLLEEDLHERDIID